MRRISEPIQEVRRPQDVREGNTRHLFRLLTEKESYTVNELAEEMNLSRTAVQNIMLRLRKYGIVAEYGKRSAYPQGGKRATAYTVAPNYKYGVYIVLSTSDVVLQINDFCNKEMCLRQLNVYEMSYEEVISFLKDNILEMLQEQGLGLDDLFGIIITLSGTVDSQQGIILNLTSQNRRHAWGRNIPIVKDIKEALGFNGVVEVDAICVFSGFFSYAALPPDKKADTCLYILAHRLGIGAVFIRNGIIDKGPHGFLGEIGHVVLDLNSKEVCRCGRVGCFEAMLYPEAIRARVRKDERLRGVGIESIEELLMRSNEGNLRAKEEVRSIGELFAQLIYNVQLVTDPDCVIFHDAYIAVSEDFHEALREACKRKEEGCVTVPIDLYIEDRNFMDAVRSGAVEYLRKCYIRDFQDE